MERAPKNVKEKETNDVLDFIYQNAMGIPIQFTTTPTLATMKANTWGVFGTDLYIKFGNNVALKFTGVNVS
ncbi:MAG TPA: hypothetical protein ENI23_06470 [bacterium]|nr:hypothetical protein [bacterium]